MKKEIKIPVKIFNEHRINGFSEKSLTEEKSEVSPELKKKYKRKKEVIPMLLNKKINWLEQKDEPFRKKVMWLIIGCSMLAIISVWVIFLKENILLENLEANMKEEVAWDNMKTRLEESLDNMEKKFSYFALSVGKTATTTLSAQDEDSSKNAPVKLNDEQLGKLKSKLMEKK